MNIHKIWLVPVLFLFIPSCRQRETLYPSTLGNQSYWQLGGFGLRTKSVRDVFLSFTLEDNSPWAGSCYINLPMAVPQGTVLHLQLDQNKPITHITETQSEWVEIAGLFPALLQAETLTISGDLWNMGLQESLSIPVSYLDQALSAALILTKSAYSMQEFVTFAALQGSQQGYRQNSWRWLLGDSPLKGKENMHNVSQFRTPANLLRDLYFFPFISVFAVFQASGMLMSVHIDKDLQIKPFLEFQDAPFDTQDRQKHTLNIRARFDNDTIIQANLPQADHEGKIFSLEPLWPYLPHAREMRMRWMNTDQEHIALAEIRGLEYRLIQAYAAWYLMHLKAASLT